MITKFLRKYYGLFRPWYFVEDTNLGTSRHPNIWKAIAAGKQSGLSGLVIRKVSFNDDMCITIQDGKITAIYRAIGKDRIVTLCDSVPKWSQSGRVAPVVLYVAKDDHGRYPHLPLRFKRDFYRGFFDRTRMMDFVEYPNSLKNMRPHRNTDTSIKTSSPDVFSEVVRYCNEHSLSWACPIPQSSMRVIDRLPTTLFVDENEVSLTLLRVSVSGGLEFGRS